MASPANKSSPLHRGDVVLVPFPFTDLTGKKVRPAIIISPDPQGQDVLVGFISSVVSDGTGPTELFIPDKHPEFEDTGLKRSSVFKASKILALHRSLVLRKLGHIGLKLQSDVDLHLLRSVGIAK